MLLGNVSDTQVKLRTGITYSRHTVIYDSKKAVVHVSKIDLSLVDIFLTPPIFIDQDFKHKAIKTTDSLLKYNADIAVNGSFFSPFKDQHLLEYYPHANDPVRPVGATISDGQLYGALNVKWPVLVILNNNRLTIETGPNELLSRTPKSEISYMLSGRSILVKGGLAITTDDERPYPRTVIGLNKQRDTLWLIVVDGKQPFYSNGLPLSLLAEYMVSLGVYDGLELDGGGSSTMAWRNENGQPALLNRPIHTKIPNRQRPVANHLLGRIKSNN